VSKHGARIFLEGAARTSPLIDAEGGGHPSVSVLFYNIAFLLFLALETMDESLNAWIAFGIFGRRD